jgi:hypothetical protein
VTAPVDRGLDYERVEFDRTHGRERGLEVCFAEVWEEVNIAEPGINHGHGILQDLMFSRGIGPFHDHTCRRKITPRDREIVATVVQWLGTNVGGGFLYEVFNRAGWKLYGPEWVKNEERLRERERALDGREAALDGREAAIVRAEAAQATRFAAQFKRELDWITLMLIANRSVFRASETTPARGRRQITLEEK